MTDYEAYARGYRFRLEEKDRVREPRLPITIKPKTSQAAAYRLGYQDAVRKRMAFIVT